VALARAVVRRPSLLLLDEPLSNLDARLREAMRRELATLIRQIGITALFVTHDQVEALSLADRVAVMEHGRIVQEGAPAEIYEQPRNLFVARFLGAANVLAGKVVERDQQGHTRVALAGGHHLVLCLLPLQAHPSLPKRAEDASERADAGVGRDGARPGETVDVVLRPENLTIAAQRPADAHNQLPGRIVGLSFQGSNVEYEVDISGETLRVLARAQPDLIRGTPVWLGVDPQRIAMFGRS
jgi:ABC-type Fe3+/spermidine/putrescine transport system ATPase subunit